MISHVVEALEPERLASCSASNAQLLNDGFILPLPQKLKINYSFPACAIHVSLGMTGISKVPTFYMQLRQH
jgi:hypothetical protein